MKKLLCNKKIYVGLLSFLCICFYGVLFAQAAVDNIPTKYTPIVDIPGIDGDSLSTEGYVQALYYLSITVAALLAMYKIMEGGIRWMFDGLITGKEEAKQQIQGAIFGLLIVLSAVLVLNTINVNLTNLNIFGNAPALDIENEVPDVEPVAFGSTISSFGGITNEEITAMEENCDGEFVATPSGGGRGTIYGCYAPITTVNAEKGDTLDTAIFDPAKSGLAETAFEESCESNGGRYETNGLYASSCEETAVPLGATLDVLNHPDYGTPAFTDVVLDFQDACAGEVREVLDADENVTSLVCE